jgi:ketosteroid isomerase-like protein
LASRAEWIGRNQKAAVTDETRAEDLARIIEARAQAVRAGQVDAIMADVADDVVTFDVVDPLRRMGKLAARSRTAAWIDSYDGPIGFEIRDLQITVDGDVAFSHALNHVSGTLKAKATVDMWFRTTLGFRRIGGRWLVVHEHGSVPFNSDSLQASLGLQPEGSV